MMKFFNFWMKVRGVLGKLFVMKLNSDLWKVKDVLGTCFVEDYVCKFSIKCNINRRKNRLLVLL
jgi:hypothetical protein